MIARRPARASLESATLPLADQGSAPGWVDDLPLFGLCQHFCVATVVLLAKAAVLGHTYSHEPLSRSLLRLPSVVTYDLLALAAVAGGIALCSYFPFTRPRRVRYMAAFTLYFLASGWIALSIANAGFLAIVGSALNPDMLSLAPHLLTYLLSTATWDTIWMASAALVICLAPLALAPFLTRFGRGRAPALSHVFAIGLLVGGLLSSLQAPTGAEENVIRNMNVAQMLIPANAPSKLNAPVPPAWHTDIVRGLEGGVRDEGRQAFSALSRKPHNVLLVVWESVGERYLRSHPLGQAATPNLDRLSQAGSVRFRRAYAQVPLSVQSVWTLFTGRTPPAKASIFLDPAVMPPHGPSLPEVLKEHGYRTSVLIGSYSRSWGADRIVKLGGVDLFEDIENLANRDRFEQLGWGIDGRAINDRFWQWLGEQPRGEPFFSVLWNVDTHYPYRWAGMSADDERLGEADRYTRVIERADALLGELASELKVRGLDRDTLIVVAGDHGEGMARPPHPSQRLHGTILLEDSIHVPLVFLHPELGSAHGVDFPVALADVFPTVLDLLGLALPDGLDGRSLGREIPPRSITMRGMHGWPAAIRSGPIKLIVENSDDPGVLYQVEEDPLESVDLAGRQPEVAIALRSHLLFEATQRGRSDPSLDAAWRSPQVPKNIKNNRPMPLR
ncbi:MAG: sulfatase-like hydrolase/transferase [Vicinamibacteria bacterium]|nr:sulfatase-like hydrolase/transferase [Vicinamibacteria bacterium]